MDITPTTTIIPSEFLDPKSETPTGILHPRPAPPTPSQHRQPTKTLPFSNGFPKRHHQHHYVPAAISYKECLKNHAAIHGLHAVDGCGEFMLSPSATPTNPTSLKCAACGCHRNFHRPEPEEHHCPNSSPAPPTIEYQSVHRHHPLPPPPNHSPDSSSPPPISSSHMLLSLSSDFNPATNSSSFPRKRSRTKFSQIQKEKMFQLAEKLGWKIQRRNEDFIHWFCNEIQVDRGVFKVWMHNNKNTLGKKVLLESIINGITSTTTTVGPTTNVGNKNDSNGNNDNDDNNSNEESEPQRHQLQHQFGNAVGAQVITTVENNGDS